MHKNETKALQNKCKGKQNKKLSNKCTEETKQKLY